MSYWFGINGPVEGVAPDDRGFQYGDGLFETIAIRHGKARLWQRHVDRLSDGCRRLGLPGPDNTALRSLVDSVLAQSDVDPGFCTLKIIVTAGAGERGYARRGNAKTNVFAGLFPSTPVPAAYYRRGVAVRLCSTRLAGQPLLAGMKTLNRLEQVLARSELDDEFEGLTADHDGRLICGTMSNVFVLHENHIETPSLARCGIAGVARAELLERARQAALRIEEIDVLMSALDDARGVVLTNSQFGALPVASIDGRRIPIDSRVETLQRLLEPAGFSEFLR